MEILTTTIYDALRSVSAQKPNAPAITDSYTAYTFAELVDAIDSCAAFLQRAGVKRGDHVALWAFNSANWFITWCGIMRLGAVAVLVNYNLPVEEIAELMRNADVCALAWGENKAVERGGPGTVAELAKLAGIAETALIDISSAARDFKTLRAAPLPEAAPADGKTPDFIIFTSGTTSKPKAVMIRQCCYLFDARGFAEATDVDVEDETLCLCAPMFHCLGSQCATKYLAYGNHVVLPKNFKAEQIAVCISDYRATVMAAVGTVFTSLMEVENFDERVAQHLKVGFVAGGSLSQTQLIRFESAYRNATFLNAYGQTETAVDIANPSVNDSIVKRSSTVGKPFPGKTVRIYDEQEGFLPPGKSGEVVVRDDGNVMLGYYKLPAERQAIDANGWLHTGDLGYIDKEGYLHLVGRLKEIIIKGGENISPMEIEKKIAEFDCVREVKVMGAPHPVYGETIVACVTVDHPENFDEAAMLRGLKDKVASFKIPWFIFCFDKFPLNDNNKIDQRALKSMMLARLHARLLDEQLYTGLSVVQLTLKNTAYNIVPVASLVEAEAARIGFSEKRAADIRTAAEEFLTERILNAYEDVGDITMDICFMSDWFRLRFTDCGEVYDIQKNKETTEGAKVILSKVDSFAVALTKDGKHSYSLDFLYDRDFDIRKFLLEHEKKD